MSDIDTRNLRFFQKGNINYIQETIKKMIKQNTGVTISTQSEPELKIIMKAIYTKSSNKLNTDEDLHRLNKITLKTTYDQVLTGLTQHMNYINNITQPLKPIEPGVNTRENEKTFSTDRFLS